MLYDVQPTGFERERKFILSYVARQDDLLLDAHVGGGVLEHGAWVPHRCATGTVHLWGCCWGYSVSKMEGAYFLNTSVARGDKYPHT